MQLVFNTLEQKVLRIAVEHSDSTVILIWSGNATPNTTKDGLDPTLSEEEHRYKFVSLPQGGAILMAPFTPPTVNAARTPLIVAILNHIMRSASTLQFGLLDHITREVLTRAQLVSGHQTETMTV
ncbi:unnamed protein product [Danaus chrysippus]|uniref:(African queen) hypothetical protein n=1 Tax=Danaus chrysippus TaxID=151541 RepID=A0A8J2W1L8_9NEOP|nr:unnamed protein product [Danaus chrysippus]